MQMHSITISASKYLFACRKSFFLIIFGILSLHVSEASGQCDTEVSGVMAYCNSFKGTVNNTIPGFFIGFRIQSNDGDTLNVIDLAGNVPMNLGKRINDINTEFEPSDTSRVKVRIAGGIDSLEYWYFGPFTDGDSFNIVLVDPDGICDTVFVASGTFTCQGQDPSACTSDVPLYFLDFSQSEWTIGGGGGINENVDAVFLIMQRSRVATCCQTGNQRCFEFIITLDEDDIGLLIDDVGNGSTGGQIFADSLNGFVCGTSQADTWPYFQENGNSADDPLCLGDAKEWIVLSCKQGNNVTGVSIGTVGELNVLPEYVYSDCTVNLEVLNATSAEWTSADDPNLDNLISFTPNNLIATFHYDEDTFGPITSCDGDTFTYFVAGYPDNTCLAPNTLLYDTTYVVVYPGYSVLIDSTCVGSNDSVLLQAIITGTTLDCDFSFIWSTGDTTQSIIVPAIESQYSIRVIREDLDSLVRDCSPAVDIIDVDDKFILCLPNFSATCLSELPPGNPDLIEVGGCGINPIVTFFDVSNMGSGCSFDSLIISRYYIVDYDGDTINTLSDRDTCIQLFVYIDNIPPTVNCPPNVTIGCNDSTLPEDTGGVASGTDNCSNALITYSDITNAGACPQQSTIIRTWMATDDCGNTSTCNQTITVRDNISPLIMCPANITIQCTDSTLPANTGTASATDICDPSPELTFTDVLSLGTCPSTITRTWRATDDCGNSSTCNQIITLIDSEAPQVVCPPDVTILCSESTNPSNTGFASGTDNCDVSLTITHTNSIITGSCPQNRIISRTWSITDDCDNFATCVQTITIVDSSPPAISCPSNIVLQCGSSTSPSQTGTATATDNCDLTVVVTYSDTIVEGSCPGEQTISRTWFATDDCGNINTCLQLITVRDTIPPVITCPANITIDCTESTLPSNTGSGLAIDICDPEVLPSYTDNIQNGACPQEFIITRQWIAVDDCGNSSSCTQIISVVDNMAPAIVCPLDVTILCTDNTSPSNTGFINGADNCDVSLSITHSDSIVSGSCPQNRIISRTWTMTDDCGNFATCVQSITVIDSSPPLITCPPNIVLQCNSDTLPGQTGMATATDNCDTLVLVSYSDIIVDGSCPGEQTISRAWLATDDCGNFATCVQTITIIDTIPPAITCPSNIVLQCNSNTLPGQTGNATATDNCDPVVLVTYSDIIVDGSCPGEQTISRTWLATDDCENFTTCIQTITIIDTTPPSITCPANIILQCTSNTLPSQTGTATATDNCDLAVVITYSDTIIDGTCPEEQTISRTWLATDNCGNINSCLQIITVRDTIPPAVTCPANITIDCTESTLPANTGISVATDNCDPSVLPIYTDSIQIGNCPQELIITRLWIATDDCGNSSSCTQIITVEDNLAPTIQSPPDVTINYTEVTLPINTGTASGTDNCDTSLLVSYNDQLPAGCPELNIIIRTWTVTDDCGHSNTCQQSILIEDHGEICGIVENDLGAAIDSILIELYADVNSNSLYDAGDTLIAITSSDTSGQYCFTDIKPCNYILVEVQPLGHTDLYDYDFSADPDGNDSLDGPDNEIPVILMQGEADHDNNFIDIICPSLLPVIPPDTICNGDSVVFETVPLEPGPLTYTWTFGNGATPVSGIGLGPHTVSYVTTTNNQPGSAIINLTVSKTGCPDLTGQVSSIIVNPYPDAAINGSTANLCYFADRSFQPVATEIPGATYTWTFGNNAVPLTATGYGPHVVHYTVAGPKTVKLVIEPNDPGAQCSDSSSISFNVTNCPGNITGTVKSVSGAPIQGVNIRLYADSNEDGIADNNTVIRSVFSTANGTYSMVSLTPASYVIVQTQPPLWITVNDEDTSNDGDAVPNIDSLDNLIPATLNPSEIDGHNIFTEAPIPGNISGSVFTDFDGDETPDMGEGISGVIIGCYPDNNKDGQPDTSTPLDTVITGLEGNYSFTTIPIGNYVIEKTQPQGYISVMDFDATDDQDSVSNTNTNDNLIPVTLLNQENDQHNYFIDQFECSALVINLNDSGPGSLRYMIDCAAAGDTVKFDSTLAGQTITITSEKIEIAKNLMIVSECDPRIMIASEVPGLFDIALNKVVGFDNLDISSGVSGNPAAAFYNFGVLKLTNIRVYRNPLLPLNEYLIRNSPGSEMIINGSCSLGDY